MIVYRSKYFSIKKKAVLELSSSSVKLLIGQEGSTNINNFKDFIEKTDTTSGLVGGKMNLGWYESNVLPVIIKYKQICDSFGVKDIVCIATAVYRKSSNCPDIFNLIEEYTGVRPILLSGDEEAELCAKAYLKLVPGNRDWILFVDQGRGSTELTLVNPRGKVSTVYSFPQGNADIRSLGFKSIISNLDKNQRVWEILKQATTKRAKLVVSGGILTKDPRFKIAQIITRDDIKEDIFCIINYVLDQTKNSSAQINPGDSSLGAFYIY